MRIDYYTLHFSISTSEALERISIVFKEHIEKDSSVKSKEGFDTVTLHEYPALEERFPEYSSFIIEPISDLTDEEYQRLAIALSNMLEAKIGNTVLFMIDKQAEPLSIKLSKEELEDNRRKITNNKWMYNYYLKAKYIVKNGKQGININDKNTEHFKKILIGLSETLIQSYEDDSISYIVAKNYKTGESVGYAFGNANSPVVIDIIKKNVNSKSPVELLFMSSFKVYKDERPKKIVDTVEQFIKHLEKYS